MGRDDTQGREHGGLPTVGGEASLGASDFEDSLLRELYRAAPLPLLPMPGERLGGPDGRRYQVLAWMGGGAMGQVFRARDETLRREVALKFLLPRPGFEAEALAEARAVARLDHENIVRIFDVAEWRGHPDEPAVPFLVMECLEGAPLSALLKRGRLEVRRALELMDGIAAGLEHAHARGIVHRDLKPGNVFLTREGTPKLLDFGISHLLVPRAEEAPHPNNAGTPAYMAPEQWRGEAQDARTDIWAAGGVLYEMLTGAPPLEGGLLPQLRERVLSPEPLPPVRARNPDVPPEVESLLRTALAKDPARRLPSAHALRLELHELRACPSRSVFDESRPVRPRRRQVVLLSCRLTGLAGLSGRVDAEDLGELEAAFHQGCEQLIQEGGGGVNLAMSDEVFACFGCPRVHEDDAQRAVHVGMRLAHAVPERLQRRLPHLPLSGVGVKVGLHTDQMVLGTRAMQGEAPRVVSWLSQQAAPGEVLVGEATWEQVRGAFETESLGPRAFTGLIGPTRLPVHRVLRERAVRVRFERTLVAGGLTPLVGRESELRRLVARWEEARAGRGACVLVSGEAGIGKSRLLQELREHLPPGPATRLRFQCGSRPDAGGLLPPLAEVLLQLLRLSPQGTPPRHLEALEARLAALRVPEEEAQWLALLLSLPVPEGAPVFRLTPERRVEKMREALVGLLLRVAEQRPVLLALEDLHWADSSWLDFLGTLFERLEGARVLVVLSARPGFQPTWPSRPWLHRLALEHLPAGLAAALVREVARGAPLPEETVELLVRKTDGIPLFIEEMTRRVLEGGDVASIPATLHGLLLARLDLLPSGRRELARIGAVVGRDFCLDLLAAITEREPADLRRDVGALVEAGLLQERESACRPGYQFRHALFQEAAYQSLTRAERRRHHQRIAQVVEERFPELVKARPEVLAHHHTEAGAPARAIPLWHQAGVLARQRMAAREEVHHFTRAVELLRGLPEDRRSAGQELRLLTALGLSQSLLWGFDAPEVARTHARGWELLRRMEALPVELTDSLWNLFSYHYTRAELGLCDELAAHVVRHGEHQRSPLLLASGSQMTAMARLLRGRTRSALESSERARAWACSSPGPHQEQTLANILSYGAIIQSALGLMEQARESGREALALARRAHEPFLLCTVLTYTAIGCVLRRDARDALALADEGLAISSGSNHDFWAAWSRVIRGRALAELGQPREGLELLRREASRWRALGLRSGRTYGSIALGEAHLRLGQAREGLAVVNEELELMQASGACSAESELYRLRGELLHAQGRGQEAKYDFFRALAVAREQGSLLFELRAGVSLGRLLRDTGRSEGARRVLSRTLARFDAGVDSVDLSEARALLGQRA